uniref:Uncharacterized protein n=1 Tax=Salmonella phage pJS4 TaxID=3141578 RepID=A0AAU7E3W4_9VIRU
MACLFRGEVNGIIQKRVNSMPIKDTYNSLIFSHY